MNLVRNSLPALSAGLLALAVGSARAAENDTPFRPPSVPLAACDPYLSIWSGADKLTDKPTQHWTGRPHPLVSLIRIDGAAYRLMGSAPADTPAFPQVGLQVLPTRTIYDFDDSHVHVTLTFMTPVFAS